MRLAQLARKLAMRPAEIVAFLAGNNIPIDEGSNTRLQDEYVALVMQEYAPSRMEEVIGEPDESEEPNAVDIQMEASDCSKRSDDSEMNLNIQASEEAPSVKSSEEVSEIRNERTEVIKAPKVELPGLKVLGKIEFPEPKKKEPPQVDVASTVEGSSVREEVKEPRSENRKGSPQKTERRDHRPKKNPIALEREREAMEAEKKRKDEGERKKELRTQHYYNKVKAPSPTKALRLMNEPVEEIVTETNPPKTRLGRFLKWLTT